MVSHVQQLPHEGPGQAALMSSGSKKRAKVSWDSRVQDSRGLGGQAGKGNRNWTELAEVFQATVALHHAACCSPRGMAHQEAPELQYSKPSQSRAVLELLATLQGRLQSS